MTSSTDKNIFTKEIKINDNIIKIESSKDGKINGVIHIINEKENKICEVNMEDSKIVGGIKLQKNNKITHIEDFNEKKNIKVIETNGLIENKITTIEKLTNGKINGKVVIQELQDKIDLSDAFFGNFVEGILTGLFKKENDKEEITGNFTDGKKEGIFNIFKKKTNEMWNLNYVNDKLDGKITCSKDNVINSFNMKNGEMEKTSKLKYILGLIKKFIKNLIKKIKGELGKLIGKIKKIVLTPFKGILTLIKTIIKVF